MTTASLRGFAGSARALWPITTLATIVALGARWGPDWPAQEFRAWLVNSAGLVAWTTRWYGGQPLPGYSILYPLLAAAAGAGGAGVLAVVASAAGAEALRPPVGPAAALCYRAAVAVALVESLITGQVPFLMGVAFGVWALWSVRAGHWPAALASAVACSLCSPLPGLFLLLIAPAWAVMTSWRRTVPLAGAGTGIAVSLAVGGASGPFPFPWFSFAGVMVCAAVMAGVAGTKQRPLLIFACCYAAFSIAAFVVPNPVGGNAARLGKLIVLPLAVLVIARSTSRRTLPALAALAVIWTGVSFVTGAAHGAADPSRLPGYYSGLTTFLRSQDPTMGRLEIPFTRAHWEAMWVAATCRTTECHDRRRRSGRSCAAATWTALPARGSRARHRHCSTASEFPLAGHPRFGMCHPGLGRLVVGVVRSRGTAHRERRIESRDAHHWHEIARPAMPLATLSSSSGPCAGHRIRAHRFGTGLPGRPMGQLSLSELGM